MRSRIVSVVFAVFLLGLVGPGAAEAEPPPKLCPSASSGYEVVTLDGWWANTMLGLDEEFENHGFADGDDPADPDPDGFDYADHKKAWDGAAEEIGFEDWVEFFDLVNGPQWEFILDVNGDGVVCMKSLPPSIEAYLFVGVDNNSASKKSGPDPRADEARNAPLR